MSKEKIIYRFRYAESPKGRKKEPFAQRQFELVREVRYRSDLVSYQVLCKLKGSERLHLEEILGGFPQRIISGEEDLIGIAIARLVLLKEEAKLGSKQLVD